MGTKFRICPKICRVCGVPITHVFVTTTRCDINDSFVVNVSAAFTSQMRDDAVELFRRIVNKLSSWLWSGHFLACVVAVVVARLFGFGLENEAAANLSPNTGADVLK